MSTTYRYLKFKIDKNLLNECKRLVYYNYADRDLKDAITACDTLAKFIALYDVPVDGDGNPTGNAPINDWPEEIE